MCWSRRAIDDWRALYTTLLVLGHDILLTTRANADYRGGRRDTGWAYAEVPRDVVWVPRISAAKGVGGAVDPSVEIALLRARARHHDDADRRQSGTACSAIAFSAMRRTTFGRSVGFPDKHIQPRLAVDQGAVAQHGAGGAARGSRRPFVGALRSQLSANRRLTRSMLSQADVDHHGFFQTYAVGLDLGAPPTMVNMISNVKFNVESSSFPRARGVEPRSNQVCGSPPHRTMGSEIVSTLSSTFRSRRRRC